MSDTGGFPLVGGSPAFPGKNNIVRDGSSSNSFGWENLNVGNLSIVGGYRNKSTGTQAVTFGSSCITSNSQAIAIGVGAIASGSQSTAFGSASATSTASIAIGYGGTTATSFSSVAIGFGCSSTGSYSVALGNFSYATGSYSFACGYVSAATRYCEAAFGGVSVSTSGDVQHGWLLLGNQSTSATPVNLYNDGVGASQRSVLGTGARWKCSVEIIATTTGAINKSASWEYKFQIDRPTNAASTIIRSTPLLVLSDGSNAGAPPAGWAVAITADTTNGCPQIQVTGDTDSINWVAALRYVQTIRV